MTARRRDHRRWRRVLGKRDRTAPRWPIGGKATDVP